MHVTNFQVVLRTIERRSPINETRCYCFIIVLTNYLARSIVMSLQQSKKVSSTGYWTFFCNPRMWEIDRFLDTGIVEDNFQITNWQRDWFEAGQKAVIRVGNDFRTLKQLDGRK